MIARPPSILIAVLFGACSGDGAARPSTTVRDSAGIRIVENAAPTGAAWTWHVDVDPLVEIGGGDDDKTQLFRVRGALRLSDGGIVVANAGSYELRFYAEDGTFLSSAGGEGGGPGEFQTLALLRRYKGDSLAVYDPRQRRVSVFDDTGVFARNVNLLPRADGRSHRVTGVFSDGAFLVEANVVFTADSDMGFQRNGIAAQRFAGDLESGDTLGIFPGTENFSQQVEVNGGRGIIVSNALFARTTMIRTAGNLLLAATNDTYEFKVLDTTGSVRMIVRTDHPPVSVNDDDVSRFISERTAAMDNPDLKRRFDNLYRDMPVPETFPAYSNILGDVVGNLWVREYNRPGDDRAGWSVFAADGVLRGVIEFPARFEPVDIGNDRVLGTWTDEDGVEYLRLYRLVKL